MATLETELDATPSPTPPPIPSSTDRFINNVSNINNDNRGSYRRSSRKSLNKTIEDFYENTNDKKKTGVLIHGAPTKEHRLLEYFLVISYGESFKLRQRSPLMDIFENFNKRVHHHHAYIVHPNQGHHKKGGGGGGGGKRKHHKHKKKKNKTNNDEMKEEKNDNNLSPNSKSPQPPKTPPPPKPSQGSWKKSKTYRNSIDDIDYANIEKLRASSDDIGSINTTSAASLGISDNPFASLRFEPCVIDRFPPLDHADTAIISTDTHLQYFCLPTGLFLTKFPSLPIFYTFVWTPETGEHLYGCCLRFFEAVDGDKIYEFVENERNKEEKDKMDEIYTNLSKSDCTGYFAPKCICIISYHSFITGYRIFLTELYRLSLTPSCIPIERYLCNFFLECPLAPRGYFSVRYNIGDKSFVMARAPSNNPLSKSSISTRILFELFTIDTLINIYKSILLEEKILFISTQYSILSLITEIFVSLLYPFTWPHVYIPLLPEDFLAFLKAPTVFIIGTHKSLLLQIGDDLDDDILVVDINHGTIQHGFKQSMDGYNTNTNISNISVMSYSNSSINIELPKHEKLKLVRFLTPVSNLLYGSHQHDFHQLDLAFPVAPTPDMIEQQEQLQQQRLKKIQKTQKDLKRKNSDSLHLNDISYTLKHTRSGSNSYSASNSYDINTPSTDSNDLNKKSKKFSLSFKFKRPTLSKMTSLSNIGMSLRNRSDSIEPPIKSYIATKESESEINEFKSETMNKMNKLKKRRNKKNSGTLQDIVESPINAIFDDAAVRNGFLRFWLSIFRSYQECIIGSNHKQLTSLQVALSEPIYEDSATTTLNKRNLNIDDGGITTEDEDGHKDNKSKSKSRQRSLSKSKSQSSVTSSTTNSNNQLLFGQSVDAVFDADKFLKSSPSQSRPFLSIFLETESFNRFITKCVFEPNNADVKYFNEKIIQKLGRSRFTKAQPTPFLNNKDYVISHEFSCPVPYIGDLDKKNGKYIYPEWPKLNPNLYSKARKKYNARNYSSKSSKDITSNYLINDEPSITFEPSKSQTITSTIISPPHNNNNNKKEKEKEKEDIIRESDEDDIVILQTKENETNPFSHDRVTYHLWFYIFLRTLQPQKTDDSQQRALHLMIKIMAQMKNENVGLPDKWVFIELIESMERMKWSDHILKLVEVMNLLQYKLDATIYSSLLNILTTKYGDLETAYNILGNLPSNNDNNNNNNNNIQIRKRKNSLLMNCDVKPDRSRKKYYETIHELQNRFSSTFPGRSIITKQECPNCHEAIHDVHIRLGWSDNDQSIDTQCPKCQKRFDAKFLIKESEEYKVWFHDINSLKSLKFFRMRGDNGTFIKEIKKYNENNTLSPNIKKERENAITNIICIGDQIIAINGLNVNNKTLFQIEELLQNPPNSINIQHEPSISISNHDDNDHDDNDNDDNNDNDKEIIKNKQSTKTTKSKLMAFMKLNNNNKNNQNHHNQPICITFRRVILCPYFSPLILYREIKKVIQNHALSLSSSSTTTSSTIKETISYRKNNKKIKNINNNNNNNNNTNRDDIKKLLLQCGISAISSCDFRIKHCELFWNLAWHFSNLRLPLHFLQNAFNDKNQINTPQIDDLIHFVPL